MLTPKGLLTPTGQRHGEGGHLVPCPRARRAQLWEQSKRRAWEGGLTSTGAHGAEGRALPRSPSDLLLQPCACEVASPRRAQSRHLYWASHRSCSGRQGTALATGKPLRWQQQCTSIASPTVWLKRLRSLGTVDGGRGCCWAPVPQPVARFFFGACKVSQARGANTGLAFAFFSPTRLFKHSPCQGMCLVHTAAGQQLCVLPKLSVAHNGMGRWQTPLQPAFNLLKSE